VQRDSYMPCGPKRTLGEVANQAQVTPIIANRGPKQRALGEAEVRDDVLLRARLHSVKRNLEFEKQREDASAPGRA